MTSASPRSARLDAEIPDVERHLDFAARHFADAAVFPWHWPPQREGGSRVEDAAHVLYRIVEPEQAYEAAT